MNAPIEHNYEQNTEEWYAARRGIVTASEAASLLTAKGEIADNATVRGYAYKKAAERINDFSEDHFQTYDMERGHFQEVLARNLYSETYAPVRQVGFVTRELAHGVVMGASPDSMVGDDGGIEIKSRQGKFQIETVVADEVPKTFMPQIQATMLVTGRQWWDFVQYSNGMKLYVKRVLVIPEMTEVIYDAVELFEKRVIELVETYHKNTADMVLADYVEVDLSCDIIASSEEA
jgi:predicted phage-related endonuclease